MKYSQAVVFGLGLIFSTSGTSDTQIGHEGRWRENQTSSNSVLSDGTEALEKRLGDVFIELQLQQADWNEYAYTSQPTHTSERTRK